MTDLLLLLGCFACLLYLCFSTRHTARIVDESTTAAEKYREYVMPVFTDILEAEIRTLEEELNERAHKAGARNGAVVAGREREDAAGHEHAGDVVANHALKSERGIG